MSQAPQEAEDEDIEAFLAELDELIAADFRGLPYIHRLGVFTESRLDTDPSFEERKRLLEGLASAKGAFVDDEGYEWRLQALSCDPSHRRLAWVEWRYRDSDDGRFEDHHYYLKLHPDDRGLIRWEIETYNPYFGCSVEWLEWQELALVMIYSEKHDTYVISLGRDWPLRRKKLGRDWQISESHQCVRYREPNTENLRFLSLPELEPIDASNAGFG